MRLTAVDDWAETQRERLALCLPVLVGTGVATWFVMGSSWWPLAAVNGVVAATILLTQLRERQAGVAICIGLVALAAGFLGAMTKAELAGGQRLMRPWYGSLYAQVERIEPLPARDLIRLHLATGGQQELPELVRVNAAPEQLPDKIVPGSTILLRARLMPPAGPAVPGAYDFAARAWFAGFGATGSVLGPVTVIASGNRSGGLADVRNRLAAHVRTRLPGRSGAIAVALITGDQGAISDTDAAAMRDSGMAHLLSISGLHVTAVVVAFMFIMEKLLALIRPLALRVPVRIIAAGAGALAAIGYTLLTGAEIPTIRSCVAALIVLAALVLGRDPFSLRLVAAGALFVMIFWPEAVVGPSFQLSFAAVTAIILLHEQPAVKRLLSPEQAGVMRRAGLFVISLLITGLAVEAALAPIAIYHFHKSGLYGAFANILAIPLTTFVIMPLEALALALDPLGLGRPVWWLCGYAIDGLLWIAHHVSAQPGAVVRFAAYPPLLFAVMVVAGLLGAALTGWVRRVAWCIAVLALGTGLVWPRPELLVTGDGRQFAVVADGGMLLLRGGRSDYLPGLLSENAGIEATPGLLAETGQARCSRDACVIRITAGQRDWDVLATRGKVMLPVLALAAACRRVDIVISERWLPSACQPRWFKADRGLLERTGGLAIDLHRGQVRTVADETAHLPWSNLREPKP